MHFEGPAARAGVHRRAAETVQAVIMLTTDRLAIGAARHALDAAGYRPELIGPVVGSGDSIRVERSELTALLGRLDATRPLETLILALMLEQDIDAAVATTALGPLIDPLLAAGLLERSPEVVRGRVLLMPHEALRIASDRHGFEQSSDFVPGAQRPTDLLAKLTVRPSCARALDLGTGCGVQALLLAAHASTVVATDVNQRALDYAAFNAALNGVTNIEFRHGSLLEPVRGEQFDLIVSNPPYVISPENRYVFRDSGRYGDAMCRELIGDLPSIMAHGALATILISWVQLRDAARSVPLDWIDASQSSGLLLNAGLQDPHEAALQWNSNLRDDPERYAARVLEWDEHFARNNIEQIGYGALVVQQGGPFRWLVELPLPAQLIHQSSDHLCRIVTALDALADPQFVDREISLAPDLDIVQTWRPHAGRLELAGTDLRLRGGLAYEVGIDTDGARLVNALAGAPSVNAAVAALAEEASDDFRSDAIDLVRRLATLGFLAFS